MRYFNGYICMPDDLQETIAQAIVDMKKELDE